MRPTTVRATVAQLVLVVALAGCGTPEPSTLQGVGGEASASFAAWCASWGLTCPTTPPPNVPDPDQPWTAAEWGGVLRTLDAILDGPSAYRITRPEVADSRLDAVAAAIGMTAPLRDLRARLAADGFAALDLDAGAVAVTADRPHTFTAASGLAVSSTSVTTARVTDGTPTLAVVGITASGPSGEGDTVDALSFADTNVLSLFGAADTVTGVPIKFLFDELFAVDLGSTPAMPGYLELQPAILPLAEWASTGLRELELDAAALRVAAIHIPPLVRKPETRQPVRKVLELLTSVRSTAASRPTRLVENVASRTFKCSIGTQSELTFDTRFGVTSLTRRGADIASVVLYGIKAKPLTGAVRPTFPLGRIDLEPTRIVIYDVPIVGTYVIDMTDPASSEPQTVTCT